jgi:hypothetical protein
MVYQFTFTALCVLLRFNSIPENGEDSIRHLKEGQGCIAGLRSGFV